MKLARRAWSVHPGETNPGKDSRYTSLWERILGPIEQDLAEQKRRKGPERAKFVRDARADLERTLLVVELAGTMPGRKGGAAMVR